MKLKIESAIPFLYMYSILATTPCHTISTKCFPTVGIPAHMYAC